MNRRDAKYNCVFSVVLHALNQRLQGKRNKEIDHLKISTFNLLLA